jgi:hypothetical protein
MSLSPNPLNNIRWRMAATRTSVVSSDEEPGPLPEGFVYLTDPNGVFLTDQDGAYLISRHDGQPGDVVTVDGQPVTVDGEYVTVGGDATRSAFASSMWTGLRTADDLDVENMQRIIDVLEKAQDEMIARGATQMEASQARAYIKSIRALVDAPEPPTDAVWDLLTKLTTIEGLVQFLVWVGQGLA